MVIDVNTAGLSSGIINTEARATWVQGYARQLAAVAGNDMPAAGDAADLRTFSQRLESLAQDEIMGMTLGIIRYTDAMFYARDQYKQAQIRAITLFSLLE